MLTATEAAARLGVDASTIRRHAAAGKLDHTRTPGGHLRIPAAALERLLRRALTGGGSLSWR